MFTPEVELTYCYGEKKYPQSHSAVAMDTVLGAQKYHSTLGRIMQSWAQMPGLLFIAVCP
jgi:hypothetical protein